MKRKKVRLIKGGFKIWRVLMLGYVNGDSERFTLNQTTLVPVHCPTSMTVLNCIFGKSYFKVNETTVSDHQLLPFRTRRRSRERFTL